MPQVEIDVRISGGAWMHGFGAELNAALFEATVKATRDTGIAVRAATPRLTGRLATSIKTRTVALPDGAQGRISTSLRYARFVERGTAEHGSARRMFQIGAAAEEPQIREIYRIAVDKVLALRAADVNL